MTYPSFYFLQDMDVLSELGLPVSPSLEEAYREWLDSVQEEEEGKVPTAHSGHGLKMWFVIRLRSKDFSENLEYNEEFGMYVPKKGHGQLWGAATSKKQLDALTEGTNQKSPYSHVFLVYKVRVRGEDQWGGLLNFLASNNMLEQDT